MRRKEVKNVDRFFDVGGPVYRVLAKIWGLMVLNFCILITSLPLVTTGVSLSAAYTVCFKMHEKNDMQVTKNYFVAFKQNFKQSMVFSMIQSLLSVLFIVDGWYFVQTFHGITLPMVGVGVTALFILFITQYLYAYIARYQDSLKNSLVNSLKLTVMNVFTSILLAGMSIGVIALMFLSSNLFVFILYMSVFIGIGFMIFLKSFLLLGIFKKYEKMKEI